MASLARKIADVSGLQLIFLSMTWLAGIYVNGFVPILPGTDAGAILANPSVATHVVLASLSAATSIFILALAWADGSTRVVAYSVLAVGAMVVAGDSGISFVLGGGSSSEQSMVMAAAFITALFLNFLALASVKPDSGNGSTGRIEKTAGRFSLPTSSLALLLFYCVFVSGMYVNLFVAGPVYSLPPAEQAAAFTHAESSAGFVVHEALGALLLLTLLVFAASLRGEWRRALVATVAVVLVAYSAYVGSLNLASSSHVPAASSAPGTQLFSSLGLMVALVVTMLLVVKLRGERPPLVPAATLT